MNIRLIRKFFSEESTIGELYVNDVFQGHILEDKDRGLGASMTLEEIRNLKIHGRTCIPYGTYEIVVSYSNRFKKYLPLLINVPGYLGIRIHPGNKAIHTEGCLLPGEYSPNVPNMVTRSLITFDALFKLIKSVEKKEKITITITK